MKLALLGTGMIVTEVLPVLTTIEGIELKAIMSTPRSLDKAKALAKQYGLAQATSDYEEILSNPEVDTIYVGTPNHTHYDYAKKALLAGKHVICEKPFTLHLEEFEELAKLAQEKELLLMEAITNQYLANFTAISRYLIAIEQRALRVEEAQRVRIHRHGLQRHHRQISAHLYQLQLLWLFLQMGTAVLRICAWPPPS